MSGRFRTWTPGFNVNDPEAWEPDEDPDDRARPIPRLVRELDLHERVEQALERTDEKSQP